MPKRSRSHPHHALLALKVLQVSKSGRYADGNGLSLVVEKSVVKPGLLRLTVQGKRRYMGLGAATLVILAEAREPAYRYRNTARSGRDPSRGAAKLVHEKNRPTNMVKLKACATMDQHA